MTSKSQHKLPIEVTDAIRALDNETRLKIVEYLLDNENLPLSKAEVILNSGLSNEELDRQFGQLSKSALIDRYTSNLDDVENESSYYKLSPFAKLFIKAMISSTEEASIIDKESIWTQIERLSNTPKNENIWKKRYGLDIDTSYNKRKYHVKGQILDSKINKQFVSAHNITNKYNNQQSVMENFHDRVTSHLLLIRNKRKS